MLNLDHTLLLSAMMHTRLSTAIRESSRAVMALEAVHLIGLTLLGGPAILIGLGALRREGLRGLSIPTLTVSLLPVLGAGLALMAVSGTLIALSMPFKYYGNGAFRWKMLLLIMALAATAGLMRVCADASLAPLRTVWQRCLALTALTLWAGVGFSGRLIGFL
jgi:hypothetical protein